MDVAYIDQFVAELSHAVNAYATDECEAGRALSRRIQADHRTLQQAMIKALASALVDYADALHDGRNEAAVRLCGAVKERLTDDQTCVDGRVYLPLV